MPLLLGIALALASLAYVLYPLLGAGRSAEGWPQRSATAEGSPARDVTDEEIEAAIRSYRTARLVTGACPQCGPRPESDAIYCSSCGRRLTPAGSA